VPALPATPGHPLAPAVAGLAAAVLDPPVRALADRLAADLLALDPGDRAALADAATARVVAFFDAAWQALGDAGRSRYVARAAARLADVLDALDPTLRDLLVEEHARGLLRDELPSLSLSNLLLLVEA